MEKELKANLGLVSVFSEMEKGKMKGITFNDALSFQGNYLILPEGKVHSDYLPEGSLEYCLDFSGVGYLAPRLKDGRVLQNLDITECPVPDQWLADWRSLIDVKQTTKKQAIEESSRTQWHKQQDERIAKEKTASETQSQKWAILAHQMIEWAKSRPTNHVLYRHKWFKEIVSIKDGAIPTELHPNLTRFGKYPKHIDVDQDAFEVFKQYGFREKSKPILKK